MQRPRRTAASGVLRAPGLPPPPGCCAGVGVDRAPQARGGPGWQRACPRGLCGDAGEVSRLRGVTASRAQRSGSAALVPAHTRRGGGRALTLGEVRARVSQALCPIGTDWPKASGTDTRRRRRGHPCSVYTPDTGTSGPSACPESSGCHGDRCFLKKQKIIFFTESKLFFLFLYRFSDVIFTFAPHLLVGRAIQWRHSCHPLVGGPRGVRSGATPTSQTSTRPGPVVRSRGPAVAAQLLVSLASVSCDLSETKAEPA